MFQTLHAFAGSEKLNKPIRRKVPVPIACYSPCKCRPQCIIGRKLQSVTFTMSSPDRAISLLSETESDGHPADALIVDKARHIAAARETAEHRKKKRRRPLADAQPSAPSPPRHAEADSAKPTGADDGRDRKKRKKASSGSRPSSVSPQPQPSQREDTRRQGKRRKKKAAAAHAVAAGSRHSTEELERLARDAPDGAVLAAINPVVSSSDSETDAEVEIIGVGRSWADETLANGTGRAGAMLPPPGSELSKLAGSAHSAATALAEVHRVTVIGLAAATTPKAAAPIGVRVIGDDEDVTVNSELQRLLRVPRFAPHAISSQVYPRQRRRGSFARMLTCPQNWCMLLALKQRLTSESLFQSCVCWHADVAVEGSDIFSCATA